MQVRRIERQADVGGIIRVHGSAWREAYDGLLPPEILQDQTITPTEEDVQQWQEALRENQEGVLVAADDEGVVRGFVDVRWGDSETKEFVGDDEAGLKAIYVDPDWWGEGTGTALLERGLEILPESIDTVRLETFAENDIASQFYESKGFERTDVGEYDIAGRSYSTIVYALQL
ncbi:MULTISPECIES: GNAT family N-acetyltransferase [Halolamina]|uniref:Acetyltransferase (GNAT) family protein n=1 Tax=Halolamina pelagica TaxID=699431 RepID=A0A1I5MDM5_9EURY|nr:MULTISPECIES: GNAT family N-acetyltransferase [Halolamina]NHX35982.1 GNAT family N-acetyltransferase [Halolamina sp. R1-12]SFP07718.1 Acetyltransferase (GNAT) family protein [Halolamina pelagica]